MKFSAGTAGMVALGLAAAPIACIVTGCATESIAATVNGVKIEEQKITDYIQNYRQTSDLMDEGKWAQYLVDNSLTPETLRKQTIDYYVKEEIIKAKSQELGVSVNEDDLNAQIEEIKKYYNYDDNQLLESIKAVGYNSIEDYRDYVNSAMLQEKLVEKVAGNKEPTDEEILQSAASYATILEGAKRIQSILLLPEDKEKAKDLKNQLNKGADFETLRAANTVSEDYDGWDVISAQDVKVTEVVKGMKLGQISDVIEGDGYLFITKVMEIFDKKLDNGFTNVNDIPIDIKNQIAESLKQSNSQSSFSTWIEERVKEADVKVNDMPKGLPYDVSLEGVTPTAEATTDPNNGQAVEDVAPGDATTAGEEGAVVTGEAGEGNGMQSGKIEDNTNGTVSIENGDTVNVGENGVTVQTKPQQ